MTAGSCASVTSDNGNFASHPDKGLLWGMLEDGVGIANKQMQREAVMLWLPLSRARGQRRVAWMARS